MKPQVLIVLCASLVAFPALAERPPRQSDLARPSAEPQGGSSTNFIGNIVTKDGTLATGRYTPTAVRLAIVEAAREILVDPYSIRDVAISSMYDIKGDGSQSVVCVKYNAKNRMGGYTGRTTTGIFIADGIRPFNTSNNLALCFWPEVKYGPFHEADILKKL